MGETKIEAAERILPDLLRSLEHCDLCRRRCGVNRLKGEKGYCRAPVEPVVYSYHPHHGEEPPLSGSKGSGAIFFSLCCMTCTYCQNWQFSRECRGTAVTGRELSGIMMKLQDIGCHNINLVSPSHFVPGIVEAIRLAYLNGLTLPIVYNTGGYDSLKTIRSLEGIVDIYLPDMRYSSDMMAERYSGASGYVENNRSIVREMRRQAGTLRTVHGNIASNGLIVRLLILPGGISGTEDTLEFIADELGRDTYVSVMSQYYPACKAGEHKELSRRISSTEYYSVINRIRELNFGNGWIQPFDGDFETRFKGEAF